MDPSKPEFNPFFNFSQPSSHNPNDDAQNINPPTPMYPNPNFPMMNLNNFQMLAYQNSNFTNYPLNFQMPFYPNPTTPLSQFPEFLHNQISCRSKQAVLKMKKPDGQPKMTYCCVVLGST